MPGLEPVERPENTDAEHPDLVVRDPGRRVPAISLVASRNRRLAGCCPGTPVTAITPTRPPVLRHLGALLVALRSSAPWLAAVAAAGAIILALLIGAFSGSKPDLGPPPGIVMVGSSWITGEASLADSPAFAGIEQRAVSIANSRWAARQALIADIAAAKQAAALRKRQDLLRKYAEERARQLAAYRALLLKIQQERAAAEAKAAAARRKYQRELAAYLRKLRVDPGAECQDPAVRRMYNCTPGMLPHPGVP